MAMAFISCMLLLSLGTLVIMTSVVQAHRGLKTGFYASTCPDSESIVRSTIEAHFHRDPTIAPALLRLHFHDCFVQGCDGSVLISGDSAERTAIQNLGLRGFEVVDDAKTKLEAQCPGIVSCADVLALAARDAVVLSDGPSWSVPTGRRDGRISSSKDTTSLPSPKEPIPVQRRKFADKGLNDHDLVTLVGAHTIGQADCLFFNYRLYNYTTTGNADPSIKQDYLGELRDWCPLDGDNSTRVALDQGSQTKFDISFFKNIRDGYGVIESDQRLWGDDATRRIVHKYAAGNVRGISGPRFENEFSKAMIKMGSIGVKTGTQGEIRNICSEIN
ncbi:Peroxidase 25 [Asimina triloba]